MKEYVRLSIDFPRKEYKYLKMMCADKEKTLKEFVSEIIYEKIESYEKEVLNQEEIITKQKVMKDIFISS